MAGLTLWTVGHSNRTLEEFLEILTEAGIDTLADVRRFPGSRRQPHFSSEQLEASLEAAGVRYVHLSELGGRRKVKADSVNTAWRNASFQAYADHMESEEFAAGLERLLELARAGRTALMCSEAVWWRCHRGLVADRLKADGFEVLHLMGGGKVQEHPYTSAARVIDGELSYEG